MNTGPNSKPNLVHEPNKAQGLTRCFFRGLSHLKIRKWSKNS